MHVVSIFLHFDFIYHSVKLSLNDIKLVFFVASYFDEDLEVFNYRKISHIIVFECYILKYQNYKRIKKVMNKDYNRSYLRTKAEQRHFSFEIVGNGAAPNTEKLMKKKF